MSVRQNKLLQIRLTQTLKNKIETTARLKGLTTSAYVKLVLTNQLHSEDALKNLNISFKKQRLADHFFDIFNQKNDSPRFSFDQALRHINDSL